MNLVSNLSDRLNLNLKRVSERSTYCDSFKALERIGPNKQIFFLYYYYYTTTPNLLCEDHESCHEPCTIDE